MLQLQIWEKVLLRGKGLALCFLPNNKNIGNYNVVNSLHSILCEIKEGHFPHEAE